MEWYYAQDAQQKGPVSQAEFSHLVQAGVIMPDTLVWKEGMENWQPYADVLTAAAVGGGEAGGAAGRGMAGGLICSRCGGNFTPEEVTHVGDSWVCDNCRTESGMDRQTMMVTPDEMEFGGFWIRFAAILVDGLILSVVIFILGLAMGMTPLQILGLEQTQALTVLDMFLFLVQFIVKVAYETVMVGRFGATLGKMALGLRVVTGDGERVSYLRAFARYFAKILSGLLLLAGYLIAAFDHEKRGLHDHICHTRVIKA